METYDAKRLVSISEHIGAINFIGIQWGETKSRSQEISVRLRKICEETLAISLRFTSKYAAKLLNEIDSLTEDNIHDRIQSLAERFEDEIEGVRFFLVNPDLLKFYENTSLAGEQFRQKFPKANFELIEAANCIVLGRYTAAVCHLMRGVEYPLRAFEQKLGVSAAPAGYYQSNTWGDILRRIDVKKGVPGVNVPGQAAVPRVPVSTEWQQDPDFFDKCYGFINAIKTPYRDRTFHVENVYDLSSATAVFEMCRVFFGHCATKLEEIK
jgi:hypothetical protein